MASYTTQRLHNAGLPPTHILQRCSRIWLLSMACMILHGLLQPGPLASQLNHTPSQSTMKLGVFRCLLPPHPSPGSTMGVLHKGSFHEGRISKSPQSWILAISSTSVHMFAGIKEDEFTDYGGNKMA